MRRVTRALRGPLVSKAMTAQPERRARSGHKVVPDPLAYPARPVLPEPLAPRVRRDRLGSRACRVPRAWQAVTVPMALTGHRDHRVLVGCKVSRGTRVLRAHGANQVPAALLVWPDRKVQLGRRAAMALTVRQALRVHRGQKEPKAPAGRRDSRALKVCKGSPVRKALKAALARSVRRV